MQMSTQHVRAVVRQVLPDVQPEALEARQVHLGQRVRAMPVFRTRRRMLL